MRGKFFYTICTAFAGGIFFRTTYEVGFAEIGLVLVVSGACAVLWRRKAVGFASPFFITSLFCLAFALGMMRMDIADTRTSPLTQYVGRDIVMTGKVVREPDIRERTIHIHIVPKVGDVYLDERVLVTLERFTYEATDIAYGDIVQVHGTLTLPEPFDTDGGRVFHYPEYLRTQKVEQVMEHASLVVESHGKASLLRALFAGKKKFIESLEQAVPAPYSGLGEGVLLGVKRALGSELDEVFRKTGIIHIVVLSGYNVLIVVEAMLFVLAYFFRPRMRMLIGLLWIVTFMMLVGMTATVVRASIMASLLLIARGTGRTYMVLRGLAIAGTVMLLTNPFLLVYDPGFQLSFLATLGLILFSPHVEQWIARVPRALGIRSIMTATLSTQIVVLPILLYQTGMFSLVSVVVNILVLPMVPIAMFLTFLTGMVGLVSGTMGSVMGYGAYLSLAYIIEVARTFANMPLSAMTINAFPFWVVVVSYVIIFGIYVRLQKKYGEAENISTPHTNISDAYHEHEGWVIEEEKEKSPETRSVSGDRQSPLPFR